MNPKSNCYSLTEPTAQAASSMSEEADNNIAQHRFSSTNELKISRLFNLSILALISPPSATVGH